MSEKKIVTLWVVGQSPRPDFQAEMQSVLGAGIEVRVAGALDGLAPEEIPAASEKDGGSILFTSRSDGKRIAVPHAFVMAQLRKKLKDANASPSNLEILACTGEFPDLEATGLLQPSQLLKDVAKRLGHDRKMALLVPLAAQKEKISREWHTQGFSNVEIFAVRPDAEVSGVRETITEIQAYAPDFVVCDCFAYRRKIKQLLTCTLGVPVILPITLVARIADELLSEGWE